MEGSHHRLSRIAARADRDFSESDSAGEEPGEPAPIESSSDSDSNESDSASDQSEDGGPPQLALPPGQCQSRDGTIWDNRPQPQTQALAHNIFGEHPWERGRALLVDSMADCFKLFFTEATVDGVICHWTNKFAHEWTNKWNRENPGQPPKRWTNVDSVEIYAFIGILLTTGLIRGSDQPLKEFWSNNRVIGYAFHKAGMSRNRFSEISKFMRFDDVQARTAIQDQDTVPRLSAIQNLFEPINSTFSQFYCSHEHVTVDEMLVSFRGNCKFRVYMKTKPGRYGIKVCSCVDATSFYVLNMEVWLLLLLMNVETKRTIISDKRFINFQTPLLCFLTL